MKKKLKEYCNKITKNSFILMKVLHLVISLGYYYNIH